MLFPLYHYLPGNINLELDEEESSSDHLHISNEGKGILVWWADSDQSWLSLSQNMGVNSGTFIVTVDTVNLDPGEHTGTKCPIQSPMGKEQCMVKLAVRGKIPADPILAPILYVSPDPDSFNFQSDSR